jgi:hypothetical protein
VRRLAGPHGHRGVQLSVAWSTEFHEPIELSDGLTFRTLRDAATYILKLPKADQNAKE